ncbi:tellurite resistance TerB family protein [Oxynema aestuarii]|jgi:tellurite resistance protein|uniref:Tellurite resistance TerB family protein n=1 Tax=Oxynema aestuarii AP17 TaxID=2064643 RepID=A0A6H1U061_9CYAN|nr:tellurite resistance TerB family protein [Oxynema aestuarii]QIZ71826.1 tellurite resistance TerB family protein [Oxynema aestuarii AP17]RMH76710.1 MAG: Tellurite resistance protein TerB [Cyanobacteria bacterium J007]
MLQKILGLRKDSERQFSEAEALAAIAVSAVAADHFFVDREMETLLTLLSEMPLYQRYSERRLHQMLNQLLERVQVKGTIALVREAKDVLPRELYPKAFRVATEIVWADGVFNRREQEFLNDLQGILEIQTETAS